MLSISIKCRFCKIIYGMHLMYQSTQNIFPLTKILQYREFPTIPTIKSIGQRVEVFFKNTLLASSKNAICIVRQGEAPCAY
jgi:uncharacterized protein (DUF427 family)